MSDGAYVQAGLVRELVQLLLAHVTLLPVDRLADDAAFLAVSGRSPESADVIRLCEIAQLLAGQVAPEQGEAISAASARLLAASQEEADAGQSAVPGLEEPPTSPVRPAALADEMVLTVAAEFKPLMKDHTPDRFIDLQTRLTGTPEPKDWDDLAHFCGYLPKALATQVATPDRHLRLWQLAWWGVQHERENGDAKRLTWQLKEFAGMLDVFPPDLRNSLLASHCADLTAIVTASTKQRFLSWLSTALADAQDEDMVRLRELSVAKNEELALAVPPSSARPSNAAPASPRNLTEQIREAWAGRPLGRDEAVAALEAGFFFLDPTKKPQNTARLEQARGGDDGAIGVLAWTAVRQAAWRCHNRRDISHADTVKPGHLAAAVALGTVVYQYSPRHRADLVDELTGIFAATVLLWELVSPQDYLAFVDHLAASVHDERSRHAIERAGAEELLGYLNENAGQQVAMRDPQPWVDVASAWTARYPAEKRAQLADLLREAGARDSIALYLLTEPAEQPADAESNSIFTSADATLFENYYQEVRVDLIADLLDRNHERILRAAEKDLSSTAHTEYLAPAGRVKISAARNSNVFDELANKARATDPAKAQEAYDQFDRALRKETRSEPRKILTEWKVYALHRRSLLEAGRQWEEAAQDRDVSRETLWNLAVYKNQRGAPWQALDYLAPSVARKTLPLSYVRFGCALAVAALLQADALPEDDRLAERRATARRFLLDYGRCLPVASMQLLWCWLVRFHPQEIQDEKVDDALLVYVNLREHPWELPTVAGVNRLRDKEGDEAVRRVQEGLQALKKPYGVLAWRLWIGEYAEKYRWWWPGWDLWATACDDDGDKAAAVRVLRQAAAVNVGKLHQHHQNASEQEAKSREAAVSFLRRAVLRLLPYMQDPDFAWLREDVRNKYVLPVPELRDPKRQANAKLVRPLGLLQTPQQQEQEQQPEHKQGLGYGTDPWSGLNADLKQVSYLEGLDEALTRRIEAAVKADPRAGGGGKPLYDALLGLLRDITRLRQGVPTDRASAVFLELSDRATQQLGQAETAHAQQLVPAFQLFRRVLRNMAKSHDAAPPLTVTLAAGWAGWPTEHESSSIPIELSFPGPGAATSIRVTGGWDGPDYQPQAEVSGVHDLAEGESAAYALALTAPAGGPGTLKVDVSYRWGPLTGLRTSAVLELPRCLFAEFLDERGIADHEFPSPFIVDAPLNREDVQGHLFQGREAQLAMVRDAYTRGRFPALPLCFYGIRKTGKTSLLHRVMVEIERAGLVGLEINTAAGMRGDTNTTDQLFLGLLTKIKQAAVRAGADPAALPLPDQHPNPMLLVDDFFDRLPGCFGGRRVVVLIDEYQTMLFPNAEPVLDSLRPVHERGRVGFIAFPNQGLDPVINTGSQLSLRSVRVDFLTEDETRRLVSQPLAPLGVRVHPSAQREIFEQAAGHPNFSAWLARDALTRLNLDHRNVLTVTDVDAAVANVLNSPGWFSQSWFSSRNLTDAEAEAAIQLAKADDAYVGVDLRDADKRLGLTTRLAIDLDNKHVVEFRPPNLRIRGRLLWAYLRSQLSVGRVPPPPPGTIDRVGLYVDLENLRPEKPAAVSYRELGRALKSYAATLGHLQAHWIVIARWNTGDNWSSVKNELQEEGFFFAHEPSTFSPTRRDHKRDVADHVLVAFVHDDVAEHSLNKVVIATGDGDMLTLVTQLIEKGITVRLVAGHRRSLSADYLTLAEQQRDAAEADDRDPSEVAFDVVQLSDLLTQSG